ncbi:MAG TPA: hypothetical protein VII99_11225, partial [Bacteroidia bacterium]
MKLSERTILRNPFIFKKQIIFVSGLIFCFCISAFSQVLNNNNAVGNITSGTVVSGGALQNSSGTIENEGTLSASGDFTNSTSGTVFGNGNYSVGGNWSNSGTFNAGTSTVLFNGSAGQTIGGSTTTNFYNLSQSNTAGVS